MNTKKQFNKKDKRTIMISADKLKEPKKEEKNYEKKVSKEEADIKNAIQNLRAKDPTAYLPTTLPFKSSEDIDHNLYNSAKEILTETGNLNEADLFLFQLPRLIPMDLDIQQSMRKEEILNDEPEYDEHGFLKSPEFENVMKTIPKHSAFGKLRIYKSGKMKMQIGKNLYDVSPGINCKFAQDLAVISPDTNEAFLLGKVNEKKLIVTPELCLDNI